MKNIAFTALTLSLFLTSGTLTFGQCFIPLINQDSAISETEHEISWVQNSLAESFSVQYRQLNINSEWHSVFGITSNILLLTDLLPCTNYEYQVRMICENDSSIFSNIQIIQTLGCGACHSGSYCVTTTMNTNGGQNIARVKVNTLDNITGNSQDSWDYTHLGTTVAFGQPFQISVQNTQEWSDNISVYIDWNQDGDFIDMAELVWNFGAVQGFLASTPLLFVPNNAAIGCTRMRVLLSSTSPGMPCPNISSSAEDYCLCISEGIPTHIEPLLTTGLKLYPNPTTDYLTIDFEENSFDKMANSQLLLYNNMGQIVMTKSILQSSTSLYLGFLPSGYYHALVLQDEKPLLRKPVIISK